MMALKSAIMMVHGLPYSPRKNNMLDLYKLGFNTNTNVSIRGGNEKTSFYTSLSYKNAKSTTETILLSVTPCC